MSLVTGASGHCGDVGLGISRSSGTQGEQKPNRLHGGGCTRFDGRKCLLPGVLLAAESHEFCVCCFRFLGGVNWGRTRGEGDRDGGSSVAVRDVFLAELRFFDSGSLDLIHVCSFVSTPSDVSTPEVASGGGIFDGRRNFFATAALSPSRTGLNGGMNS